MTDRIQKEKNIVLFVSVPPKSVFASLREFSKKTNRNLEFAVIYQKTNTPPSDKQKLVLAEFDHVFAVNLEIENNISEALAPIRDRLLVVSCRAEAYIPHFQKVIPHVPYLRTPTVKSLEWATNKIAMRRRFRLYDKKITPEFMIVQNAQKKTLNEISDKVGFPLVIKPTGVAQSLLVNIVYHKEELEKELRKVFRKMNKIWKDSQGRGEPTILVEQFMDGDMYSVEAFVSSRGKVHCCPPVGVKTGRTIGFDDFFGYQQMTPTLLNKQSIDEAYAITEKAIHAVGLRSSSAHVELMKTEQGWKVIELGPRLGGFRYDLYKLAFNIDITNLDIAVRIPEKITTPKTPVGNAVAFKFFAHTEGYIKSIIGIKKAQELASFYSIVINKQVGDRVVFAKNGGKSVFNITLFNKDRSLLLADMRRLEQLIKIEVSKKQVKIAK